jgi:hypothetical protein
MSDTTTTTDSTSESARPPVLAVDLDGTVIDPETEELIPGAKDALLMLHKLGWKIVIWTARGNAAEYVPHIMNRHGLPYDAVNENLEGDDDKSRKIQFDAVVDNKNIDLADGWEEAVRELEHRRKGWRHQKVTKVQVMQLDPMTGEASVEQIWGLNEKGHAVLLGGAFLEKGIVEIAVPVENGKDFLAELLKTNGTFVWAEAG